MIKKIHYTDIDTNKILDHFKYISVKDIRAFKDRIIKNCEDYVSCYNVDCKECMFATHNMSNKVICHFDYSCGRFGGLMPFSFDSTPKRFIIEYLDLLEQLIISKEKVNKLNL